VLALAGLAALLLAPPFWSGCASGDQTLDQRDPLAVPANPQWDRIYDLIDRECAPCHGGSVEPALSTCDQIVREAQRIRFQVLEIDRMPPGAWPRLSSEDKLLLQRWLDQGAKAPCR